MDKIFYGINPDCDLICSDKKILDLVKGD
jgi:hypothetical protein